MLEAKNIKFYLSAW